MAQKQQIPEHCSHSCEHYLGVLFQDRGQGICAPIEDSTKSSLERVCYFVKPGQECVNNKEQGRIWKPA